MVSASRRVSGFTYLGLLMVVAIISMTAAVTVQTGAILQRRQAEDELIFVGLQFKKAIRDYFEKSPSGVPSNAPARLEDLLRDPRFPQPVRHLRKIYVDPMTGTTDWGLIRTADGRGILGVYSKSKATPIRIANFPDEVFHFEGKKRFSDWVFVYGVVCQNMGCELPQQPMTLGDQPNDGK